MTTKLLFLSLIKVLVVSQMIAAKKLTFDTRTFYNFALAGNLEPFEELKVLIEEAIEEKKEYILSKRKVANEELIVVVLAGVAAELNRKEKFEECIKVEEWWQKPILNGYTKT